MSIICERLVLVSTCSGREREREIGAHVGVVEAAALHDRLAQDGLALVALLELAVLPPLPLDVVLLLLALARRLLEVVLGRVHDDDLVGLLGRRRVPLGRRMLRTGRPLLLVLVRRDALRRSVQVLEELARQVVGRRRLREAKKV